MPHRDAKAPELPTLQKVAECLYRHSSSGTYYALVKRAGKQHRRSLKTKDRKVAERFLSDFRQKVTRLSHTMSASRVSFRDMAGLWLDTLRAHLKPASMARRETSVGQLNDLLGSMTLKNITSRVCEEWSKKRGQALSASTYNNERDTLRLIFEYAKKEGVLLDNPADDLPRRKLPRNSLVIPTKEQFSSLLRTLRDGDQRRVEAANLVELLAYSGMRLREATAMRWADVDFEQGRFTVTGGEGGTKNLEMRAVPLFPALRAFLERLRASRQPPAIQSEDLVARIASAKRSMEYACKKADLPDFTHHAMRHYFVTNAIEAGVDYKAIAGWVGHKDGGLLVARTYGHLRDQHSYEMAKRMTFSG